jgi:hypothetical protein
MASGTRPGVIIELRTIATRENSMRVFLPAHECQMNGERAEIWQRCGVPPHAAHSIECHRIF